MPDALALCQQIVKTVPGFADAWLLLCQLQLDIQRPDRAMQCVERALALKAGNPKAALLRAECLIANHQPAEARIALEALESGSQQNALMLRLLGNIYAGILSYDDAFRCFQRAVKLDAEDIECWHLKRCICPIFPKPNAMNFLHYLNSFRQVWDGRCANYRC